MNLNLKFSYLSFLMTRFWYFLECHFNQSLYLIYCVLHLNMHTNYLATFTSTNACIGRYCECVNMVSVWVCVYVFARIHARVNVYTFWHLYDRGCRGNVARPCRCGHSEPMTRLARVYIFIYIFLFTALIYIYPSRDRYASFAF